MARRLATSLAVLLLAPAAASAGEARAPWSCYTTKGGQMCDGGFTYAAAAGEANRVTVTIVDGRYVVHDDGARAASPAPPSSGGSRTR